MAIIVSVPPSRCTGEGSTVFVLMVLSWPKPLLGGFFSGPHGLGIGETIHALVLLVTGVALDPDPLDLALAAECIELLPQGPVLYGLLISRFPPSFLPAGEPLSDPVDHILAVAVEGGWETGRKGSEGPDGGCQLHLVVGRCRIPTTDDLLLVTDKNESCVATWARVSDAGPIRENEGMRC